MEKQNIKAIEISGASPKPLPESMTPVRIRLAAASSCQVSFSLNMTTPSAQTTNGAT